MPIRLEKFSYRFAEQVMNARLAAKQEIEDILTDRRIPLAELTRPKFNEIIRTAFMSKGWIDQPAVFEGADDPSAKLDFLKDRIGIEVQFGHSSFIGIDLLKFQVASYSALDRIDVAVYVVSTRAFQKHITETYGHTWEGSLAFEKVTTYLPHFKSAIQVPIYVLGIDV